MTGRGHGQRLNRQDRAELVAAAKQMSAAGWTQRRIANQLLVSQPTVSYWLAQVKRLDTAQQRVADEIRGELVCCDIYERMEAVSSAATKAQWAALRDSDDFHDICFFGEWAARIAERTQ